MSNIVCPDCWASPLVEHRPGCSRPAYVDKRNETPCRCGRDRYSTDGECAACPGEYGND